MSLISPWNFLFAGLFGLILLLYMLRLKRREKIIASNLLWDSALRDLQANAPWQKLRSSLLMWLQLAFVALAVLALVRPAIKVLASGGQTVAIVMDSSGSMEATDVLPSRFEKARGEANRLVNGMASGDLATVLAAGRRTRVLAPLTEDKNALKRAISGAKTQDTTCNLREAVVLAASLLRGKKNPQIYVLSDGAVPTLQDLNVGAMGVQFVKIGLRSENIALTALDVRRGYSGAKGAQVFATLSNFSRTEKTVNLELSHDGDLLEVRPVTIPAATTNAAGENAAGQASELFDDLQFEAGLFSARFDQKDDLASDNIAYATLAAPRPLKVLLYGDNLFLEKALNLDLNVQLMTGGSGGGDFDVVVCDGAIPANVGDANLLVFNAFSDDMPVQTTGKVALQPSVADYDRTHPVTRYAPWNDLKFAQSQAATLKPWGKALVEGERSPLIAVGERGARRVVWCGFDLRETDFPLRVAFPIFITNSLHWLTAPRGGQNEGAPQRAGQIVPLSPPAGAREITITAPDKSTQRVPVQNPPLLYDGADQVGIYTASSAKPEWQQQFAVSLLSKSESDLMPRAALKVGEKGQIAAENSARANRELWGYFILAALAILGIEWWVFHRGV